MEFAEIGSRRKNLFGSVDWGTSLGKCDGHLQPATTNKSPINPSIPILSMVLPTKPDVILNSGSGSSKTARSSLTESSTETIASSFSDFQRVDIASACAFLGDELSAHNRDSFDFHKHPTLARSKAQSLESFSSVPFLMKMPACPSRKNFDKFLETIPATAWMMPYIISCSPPVNLLNLTETKLSGSWSLSSSLRNRNFSLSALPTIDEDKIAVTTEQESSSYYVGSLGHASFEEKMYLNPNTSHSTSISTSIRSGTSSSWRSLGVLLISSDPSWMPWEPRYLVLMDNFLFECQMDASSIIGFAALNNAEISSVLLRKLPRDGNNNSNRKDGTTATNISQSPAAAAVPEQILTILVSYLSESTPSAPRRKVWIRCSSFQDTADLQDELIRLASLSMEDTYDFNTPDGEDSLLSTGRFTEVRMARRRNPFSSLSDCYNNNHSNSNYHNNNNNSSSNNINNNNIYNSCPAKYNHTTNGYHHNNNNSNCNSSNNNNGNNNSTNSNCTTTTNNSNINNDTSSVSGSVSGMTTSTISHPKEIISRSRSNDHQYHRGSGGSGSAATAAFRYPLCVNDNSSNQRNFNNINNNNINSSNSNNTNTNSINISLSLAVAASSSPSSSAGYGYNSNGNSNSNGNGPNSCSPSGHSPSRGFHVLTDINTHMLPSSLSSLLSSDSMTRSYSSSPPPPPPLYISTFEQQYCALKTISKRTFFQRVRDCQERADSIVREVLCQSISCQVGKSQGLVSETLPIVEMYGAFETVDKFAMELELMQSSDLCDKLHELHKLTENEVQEVLKQILQALILCSSAGIGHRDVKLSNITIARPPSLLDGLPKTYSPDAPLKVKLADFGMAGFVGYDGFLRGRCGTIGYVAPEILRAGVHEGYANNVDMFSLGVVGYTLLCGHEPFYGIDDKQLKEANKSAWFDFNHHSWRHISVDAKDWICKALCAKPELRMTLSDALHHPWLSQDSDSFI